MLNRRHLLLVPMLAVLPGAARDHGVSEIRIGGPAADAGRVHRALGVPVRAWRQEGLLLVRALNAGHVEAAWLDLPTARATAALMADRVWLRQDGDRVLAIRSSLPAALRADLAVALA